MRFLLSAFVVLCLLLVVLMDLGQLTQFQRALHYAPYGDKMMHALTAGLLTLLLNLTLLKMHPIRPRRMVLAGALLVAVMCSIEEATNLLTPYRGCEVLDLLANYTGILLLGLMPALYAVRHTRVASPVIDGLG